MINKCFYCLADTEINEICEKLNMQCPDCAIKHFLDAEWTHSLKKAKPKPRKTKSKSKPKAKQPKDDVAMSSRLKAFLKQNGKK